MQKLWKKGKTENEKELEQKKEKGSHWADPGTGPAQQPPNQPTRGRLLPSLSFTFSLFCFYADGRDPPVSIIPSNGFFLTGNRRVRGSRPSPLLNPINSGLEDLPCLRL
jgi:hypothetical protein